MKFKLLETENRNALFAFAFVEFILIVVGILFALQIDNWNENRKARKSELHYLDALQEEFSDNLNRLKRVMRLAGDKRCCLILRNEMGRIVHSFNCAQAMNHCDE